MKNIIALFMLSAVSLFAQSEQQGGIELPDFVITGRQNIDLPSAVKKKPELISTISKEFLTPVYQPEELQLFLSSEPMPEKPSIFDNKGIFNSSLRAQVGQYSIPEVKLSFNQTIDNYIFSAKAFGSNTNDYVTNAGSYRFGGLMEHEVFISTTSDFLPGTIAKLGADYYKDSYKFFGSMQPQYLRETNLGSVNISFTNQFMKWFHYGVKAKAGIFQMNDTGLKETNISGSLFTNVLINGFKLSGSLLLQNQSLKLSTINSDDTQFLNIKGDAELVIARETRIKAGVNFSSNQISSFFQPFISAEYKIAKGIIAAAEYMPDVKFLTIENLALSNPYVRTNNFTNVTTEYPVNLKGTVRYEYQRLFSVTGLINYSTANNYTYFDDSAARGFFDVNIVPEAKIVEAGIVFNYFPTIYGYFYSELNYKSYKDGNNFYIPYKPSLSLTMRYGNNFLNGFAYEIGYEMFTKTYTNLLNTGELENFHNFSAQLSYEFFSGFKIISDFQNIFNRSNFVWNNYKNKPFDILLGIEYRW